MYEIIMVHSHDISIHISDPRAKLPHIISVLENSRALFCAETILMFCDVLCATLMATILDKKLQKVGLQVYTETGFSCTKIPWYITQLDKPISLS